MKTWKAFCFLFLVLLCLCISSCATGTGKIDLTEVVAPVLGQRPDNSVLEVYPGPIYELKDVVLNMHTYLTAWEMWQAYAESLEETISVIQEKVSE